MDWFSTNQLHLHQGPKSIVGSNPTPFPLHVNQISTLQPPHVLVRTISQVRIPTRMLAVVPATFNSTPKPDSYYNYTEMPYDSQQNLFVVLGLQIFDTKLPLHLLCTIINASPDDVTLQRNQHIGEMKPLSNSNDPLNSPVVNEVTHDIDSDCIDAQWMQPHSYSSPSCKSQSNS